MKKLVFVLAMACSLQVAFAQKPAAEMQKAVDTALEATKDAKKAAKPAPWMKLGDAYMAAYNNPLTNITLGLDKATFQMMNKEKPVSVSSVTIEGQPFEKMQFAAVDAYFNAGGMKIHEGKVYFSGNSYKTKMSLYDRLFVYERRSKAQRLLVICSYTDRSVKFKAPRGYDLKKGKLILRSHGETVEKNGFTTMPYETRVYLFQDRPERAQI